jgi:alpha-amylase/alpha-mannosidase (GH57 family)
VSCLFCVHGHFYQPAREHPWLDVVEVDDTASPAHDWNSRITAECYAPNAAARILDAEGRIVRIVNNYEAMSFNVGPTLARWLERGDPDTYAQIVAADRASFIDAGFGNAIAQVYNHLIMPLASRRDKVTQVRWGIADFRHRFGRQPHGMWIAETAVDLETLEVLAEHEIRFTVLAPQQAARVRALPGGEWVDVTRDVLDVTRAYLCRPAPGREIVLLFYDGAVAQEIAFGALLDSGEQLARRLSAISEVQLANGRLAHVATDGETYGHHHRFGEMALAYAVEVLGRNGGRITNYTSFLAEHPPTHEVQIHERTSWSCPHGIERWRSDCGCGRVGGNQQRWRAPLREALDALKVRLDEVFEGRGAGVFHDPWAARDAYIDVILDRSPRSRQRFLDAHTRAADADLRRQALQLLEMQRHGMLMFSSDGWFFDEPSRGETAQILRHAARAVQIAAVFGADVEAELVAQLRLAEGNLPAYADGAAVYARLVRPAVVDARRVAAHHAIMSLFEDYPDEAEVYAYRVTRRDQRRLARGTHTLITARAEIEETLTGDARTLSCATLHFGGTDVHCCVVENWDDATHARAADALVAAYETGTVTDVIRSMDDLFGREFYTLRDLFVEERRAVLAKLSAETMEHLEASYRLLYQESRGLLKTLRDAEVPVPQEFRMAAEFVLTTDLRRALDVAGPLTSAAWDHAAEARALGVSIPGDDLAPLLRARIERCLLRAGGPTLADHLEDALRALDFAQENGIAVDLWRAQNLFHVRLVPRLAEAGPDERAALFAVADRLHFSRAAVDAGAGAGSQARR